MTDFEAAQCQAVIDASKALRAGLDIAIIVPLYNWYRWILPEIQRLCHEQGIAYAPGLPGNFFLDGRRVQFITPLMLNYLRGRKGKAVDFTEHYDFPDIGTHTEIRRALTYFQDAPA